ncbi:leucine-rich repeat domain-containing protein [uncultured Polaribacter sp.]|uniref:leucine-rich repeat domain-containing protein n=1 Tax=uncultured Polaribacter sp. TaxID=174711 RepID=UPI00262B28CC|nr:leucine-rich repeat domain-containing protein [uncultured Polaribacter sp.]
MKKTLLLFITLLTITVTNAQLVAGDTFEDSLYQYSVSTAAEAGSPNTVSIIGTVDGATIPNDLVIPVSVTHEGVEYTIKFIANGAFSGTAITSLVVQGDAVPGNQAFFNCASLTSVSFPVATGDLGRQAFRNCTALTSVSIPNITSLNVQTFRNCTALENIDLPSVSKIGLGIGEGLTFWQSAALKTVNMPVIDSIYVGAFNGTGLTSITLPASLDFLDETNYNMFRGISTLAEVIVESPTPLPLTYNPAGDAGVNSIFNTALSTATLKVTGAENVAAYQQADVWKDFSGFALGVESQELIAVNAYPNPVKNKLYFRSDDVDSVEIYNILGAKISSQKVVNGVDVSSLNRGIYLVKAKNNEGLAFKTIRIFKDL